MFRDDCREWNSSRGGELHGQRSRELLLRCGGGGDQHYNNMKCVQYISVYTRNPRTVRWRCNRCFVFLARFMWPPPLPPSRGRKECVDKNRARRSPPLARMATSDPELLAYFPHDMFLFTKVDPVSAVPIVHMRLPFVEHVDE